jgi:colanic acid/amylovoran biosynthesis glycosyltransferase
MLKNLILLCDSYPIGLGEFFLDDEMKIANDYFENIEIIVPKKQYQLFEHYRSNKMKVYQWEYKLSPSILLKSFFFFFSATTLKEIWSIRNHAKRINCLKIIIGDILKSSFLLDFIKNKTKLNNTINDRCVFYSYWNDYKALTLARLSTKTNGIFISRAHASDIFAFRSEYNYLPFKRFILSNLDQTFSISTVGKVELQSYLPQHLKKLKVSVSRLGIRNQRKPLLDKINDKITICSCSHFNKIKRVHLIPKILKRLNNQKIHWVHFGWGYAEYEKLVHDELMDAQFTYEFKGITENEKILDYYCDNYVDFFINTSFHEGIPVSIMEAFSAGIPAIATNVGATNEIIDESCGFLLDENFDIYDATQAISGFLNNNDLNRVKFRKDAYKKWGNEFEVNKNYSNFYSEIKSILSNKTFNQ